MLTRELLLSLVGSCGFNLVKKILNVIRTSREKEEVPKMHRGAAGRYGLLDCPLKQFLSTAVTMQMTIFRNWNLGSSLMLRFYHDPCL